MAPGLPICTDEGGVVTTTRAITVLTLDDVVSHCDLRFQPAVVGEVPRQPGVYCHVDPQDGAVLYIGSATGAYGLRRRLGNELTWIAETERDYPDHLSRRTSRAAVIAGLVEHRTQAHFATTTTPADARDWERRLLHLSVLLTGAPPILRGWNIRGVSADAFAWMLGRISP